MFKILYLTYTIETGSRNSILMFYVFIFMIVIFSYSRIIKKYLIYVNLFKFNSIKEKYCLIKKPVKAEYLKLL
jgi:hypothetical protein